MRLGRARGMRTAPPLHSPRSDAPPLLFRSPDVPGSHTWPTRPRTPSSATSTTLGLLLPRMDFAATSPMPLLLCPDSLQLPLFTHLVTSITFFACKPRAGGNMIPPVASWLALICAFGGYKFRVNCEILSSLSLSLALSFSLAVSFVASLDFVCEDD